MKFKMLFSFLVLILLLGNSQVFSYPNIFQSKLISELEKLITNHSITEENVSMVLQDLGWNQPTRGEILEITHLLHRHPDKNQLTNELSYFMLQRDNSQIFDLQPLQNSNKITYPQSFSEGPIITPVLEDFQVNENAGQSVKYYPVVAVEKNGGFMVAWEDYRNGARNIFGQYFYSDGSSKGTNFKINESSLRGCDPSIAVEPQGGFWVVWENYYGIVCQRYSNTGISLGSNFAVGDSEADNWAYYPQIRFNDSGNAIIIWNSLKGGNMRIFA